MSRSTNAREDQRSRVEHTPCQDAKSGEGSHSALEAMLKKRREAANPDDEGGDSNNDDAAPGE